MYAFRHSPLSASLSALAAMAALASATALANNLQIGAVSIRNIDRAAQTADISFSIAWDNSWRGTWDGVESWDAAWIFAKYRTSPDGEWSHVWLAADDSAHTAPAGAAIDVGTTDVSGTPRGIGAFLHAASDEAGGVEWHDVRLRWPYGAQGLNFNVATRVELAVLGVEMVRVAPGAFWAGNLGGPVDNSFRDADDATSPVYIDSEDAVTLYYGADPAGGGAPASYDIPAAFPKGVTGFYCMKYMITQGQWADFLNLLTRSQQERVCAARVTGRYMCDNGDTASSKTWNYVYVVDDRDGTSLSRVYEATYPDLCCNWISYDDAAYWCAWSGLRPMTELEFEKACRGPLSPVADEYVWGDTTITNPSMEWSPSKVITGREVMNVSTVNSSIQANTGFLQRAGIFATETEDANRNQRTRSLSGAAYFGAMEMGSVLNDLVITTGKPAGLAFTGAHGDGSWTLPANWPAITWWAPANGVGYRGGNWYEQKSDAMLASRRAALAGGSRLSTVGFRAVRTEP